MVSVCLHTPATISLWPPLNYVILASDCAITLVFIVEAVFSIHQNGLWQHSSSYLRSRWSQFDLFLLLMHVCSCALHAYEMFTIWFPSMGFQYQPWLGVVRSPRPFIMVRFIRSIVRFKLPKNRIKQIMKRSSQQIQNVTIFFMFFMALYAIMGVQLFGRMDYHCVLNGTNPQNVTIADDTMCSQKGEGRSEINGVYRSIFRRADLLRSQRRLRLRHIGHASSRHLLSNMLESVFFVCFISLS